MLHDFTSCTLRLPIRTLWHLPTATVCTTALIADVDDYLEETLQHAALCASQHCHKRVTDV